MRGLGPLRHSLRSLGAFGSLFAALALAQPAVAQSPQAEEQKDTATRRTAARFLAEQGDEELHHGRYEEALALYRAAEALFHAPTLRLAMAQAELKLGRLVDAYDDYKSVIDQPLAPGDPIAFHNAKQIAKRELAALEPRIPRLTVEVQPRPDRLEVRIDGKAIRNEVLGRPRYVDVGEHTIVVTSEDKARARKLTLAEGEAVVEAFDLTDAPVQTFATGEAEERSLVWPLVGYGVGAAGLALGIVTGVMALNDAAELRESCARGTTDCDPALAHLEDSANTLATVSTVGFIVGGVGVAVGTTLLLIPVGQDDDAQAVQLSIGPGSVGISGRF